MPIIINGGSYSAGGWWGKHLQKAETNERVAIIEFAGLSAETIPDAFREMEALAANTKCKNYFYQANINPRADEQLTPAQWREAVDRLEKNLGFTGQPRFVSRAREGGPHAPACGVVAHRHRARCGQSRIRSPPPFTNARRASLKSASTSSAGRASLSPIAKPHGPIAGRRSTKSSAPTKRHRPGDGQSGRPAALAAAPTTASFKAALEASGDYMLARGDRRDFVIIDRAGDDHSLARRLGIKALPKSARAWPTSMRPACRASNEAKAQQRERQARPNARTPAARSRALRQVARNRARRAAGTIQGTL